MRTIVLHYDAVGNQTLLEADVGCAIAGGAIVGRVFDYRNSYSYDRRDRLTSITHGGTAITGAERWDGSATPPASLGTSELLAGYTFAYDQASRLTELRSWADGTQTGYGYDDRSQLVSAATTAIAGMTPPFGLPGGEGYDFDAGGNRKSGTGASQSASGTHNQLQSDGTYNYFYDAEGNLIRRESIGSWAATLYEWDHRNRLVAVKEAPFYQAHPAYQTVYNLYVEYIYDAFDQRVGKRVEDTTDPPGIFGPQWKRYEAYVWADGQEVLRFTDSDGLDTAESFRLASRYLWSNQVDQLLAEEQYTDGDGPVIYATGAHTTTGETLWPLTDHLGSVRGLVDNNGIIRQHVAYDSFGNRLVEQHYNTAGAPVSASHAEAVDTLFGYTGRDWDTDTNLQYNRARWYDPSTGRWMSQDPIGFSAGDGNLYRYVENRPTTLTDPSGLNPNQQGAIDGLDLIRIVQGLEEAYFRQYGRYPNWLTGLGLLTDDQLRDPGTPGSAGSNHYYVFSQCDRRWLDVRHFSQTGYLAGKSPVPESVTGKLGGWAVEAFQKAVDLVPGNSPNGSDMSGNAANSLGVEDDYSNMEGARFVDYTLRRERAGLDPRGQRLSVLLQAYINQKSIGSRNNAATLSRLPLNESEWQAWHHQGRELVCEEGTKALPVGTPPPRQPGVNRFTNPPDIFNRIRNGFYEVMDWRTWTPKVR